MTRVLLWSLTGVLTFGTLDASAVGAVARVAPAGLAASGAASVPVESRPTVRRSLLVNGTFEAGTRGWARVTPRSRAVVATGVGVGRSGGALLPASRTHGSALTDDPVSATGVRARDVYTARALVRGSRPGMRLRLRLTQLAPGGEVLARRAVAVRTRQQGWKAVTVRLATKRAGGVVDLTLGSWAGRRSKVVVDDVRLLRVRRGAVSTSASAYGSGGTSAAHPYAAANGACGAQGKFAPACGALWGVYTLGGSNPATAVTNLESRVGRRFDLSLRYHDFSTHPTLGVFPDASERRLGASRTLFMSWQARVGSTNTNIRWARIASGGYDSFIRSAAKRLRAWKRPVIIAFDPEFDNLTSSKGPVSDYVAAYRRIVKIFRGARVSNVAWAWVPTGYLGAGNDDRTWAGYPGDSYVDWVGYDPYNFYRCNKSPWKTFEKTIAPAYNWFRKKGLGDKPFLLSEYGTQYDAANPSVSRAWYRDIPRVLQRYPNLKGLIRFDANGVVNSGATCRMWIDNGPGMLSAWAAAGRSQVAGYRSR